MVTLLLLGLYLPVGLVPAFVPLGWLRRIEPIFPFLALVPAALVAAALLFAARLTAALGYTVAFIPLLVSVVSLALGVVGARLAMAAHRQGRRVTIIAALAAIAALPFAISLPYLVAAWVGAVSGLLGSLTGG